LFHREGVLRVGEVPTVVGTSQEHAGHGHAMVGLVQEDKESNAVRRLSIAELWSSAR
jgi:hypothetical protein